MDESYDRLLCSINQSQREKAIRLLNTLRVCPRPLTFQEVVDVCAVNLPTVQLDKSIRVANPDDLIAICPGLIDFETTEKDLDDGTFIDVQLHLRASNPGILEYLQSDRIKQRPTSRYAPDVRSAHTDMARICLINLLDKDFATTQLDEDLLRQLPFARYAATYWYYHFRSGDREDELLQELLEQFFAYAHANFKNWVRLHDLDTETGDRCSLNKKSDEIPRPTYYASLLGLTRTLHQLLSDRDNIYGGLCGRYGTPLQAAAATGHVKAVSCLLDADVDVNATGGRFITALNAAVSNCHEQVVCALLAKGASVTIRLAKGESVLHTAASNSSDTILWTLLNHEPDLYLKDWDWRTPLHWAIARGNRMATTILASHNNGMYLAVRDVYGWTALHLAIRRCEWTDDFEKAKALVIILLEAGAVTSVRSCSGKTCEDEVAAFGECDTFQHVQKKKPGTVVFSNRKQQLLDLLHEHRCTTLGMLEYKRLTPATIKQYSREWASLRPWISEVLTFPYENRGVKSFSTAYQMVHEYCVSQRPSWAKSDRNWKDERDKSSFDPKLIYEELREHLRNHVKDVVDSMEITEPANYQQWYVSEWDKFMAARKRIMHVFRYLDRHLVTRCIDEGHKRLYHIDDLHMVEWSRQFFHQDFARDSSTKMTDLVLKAIDEYPQDGSTPGQLSFSLLKSVTELIWSERLSVEKFVEYMRSKDKWGRHCALMLLLEWGADVKNLYLVNTMAMQDWHPVPGLDLLVDLLDPKVKVQNEDGKACDTLRAAYVTSAQDTVPSKVKVTHEDCVLLASQFDRHAMERLSRRRSLDLEVDEAMLIAAAENPTHAMDVVLALLEWYPDILKVSAGVVEAAVKNHRYGMQLLTYFLDERGTDFIINDKIVQAAAHRQVQEESIQMITLLYERQPQHFRVNENAVKAAARNSQHGLKMIRFFLDKCGDQFTITEAIVDAAVANYRYNLPIMKLLLEKRGNDFKVTKDMIKAIPSYGPNKEELASLLAERLRKQ